LLGCNGQPGEPWYCNLLVDLPNLLTLKNVSNFCGDNQPLDPGFPDYADFLVGHAIEKLGMKAESMAWAGLCVCKPEDPPTDNPPPPPGFKDFPVKIPRKPNCFGNAQFAFYNDRSYPYQGQENRIIAGLPPGLVKETLPGGCLRWDGDAITLNYGFHSHDFNFEDQQWTTYYYGEVAHDDPTGNTHYGYYVTSMVKGYGGSDLTQKLLRMKQYPNYPLQLIASCLDPCPEDPPPPPPDRPPEIPPPPNGCCPPSPADFAPLIDLINQLQEQINNLRQAPIIGESRLESPDEPYGVYIRYTGGG
jgi:hypothetical protein